MECETAPHRGETAGIFGARKEKYPGLTQMAWCFSMRHRIIKLSCTKEKNGVKGLYAQRGAAGRKEGNFPAEQMGESYVRRLIIPLADHYISWCCYRNENQSRALLEDEIFEKALQYCRRNKMEAVLIHPRDELLFPDASQLKGIQTCHVVAAPFYREATARYGTVIPVFEPDILRARTGKCGACILNIEQRELLGLAEMVGHLLLEKADRVIVNLHGMDRNFDREQYREQLLEIVKWLTLDLNKEVNLITDRIYLRESDSCKAGSGSFVLSRQGEIYSCIGMMEEGTDQAIGSLAEQNLCVEASCFYRRENHPICRHCDAFQCRDCAYRNYKENGDIRIASAMQCRKAHAEREISRLYQNATGIVGSGRIGYVEYIDPIERIR